MFTILSPGNTCIVCGTNNALKKGSCMFFPLLLTPLFVFCNCTPLDLVSDCGGDTCYHKKGTGVIAGPVWRLFLELNRNRQVNAWNVSPHLTPCAHVICSTVSEVSKNLKCLYLLKVPSSRICDMGCSVTQQQPFIEPQLRCFTCKL